ncbi:hypothetical protein DPMN_132399 [Dreissena polymorpha]|uniref:Uncharacterized protein n=1 Tax=Dreissena polymorpha TaxID=45954 RepID=A0A9D4FTA3_DREPO|nr:hypothetical protein DPMN_132399 [Dreissena polymorpha]
MDNDILQEDLSISGVSVSPARHNKRCRNFLCVFILFSIITVAAAAIGAAIYLTYDHQDVSSYNNTNNNQHHHADHIDWDLHHDDQAYLTEKFCDLMKALLASVDFPVRIGIESCTTSLK